jgi:short-subunit dehydrogenase
VGVCDAKAERLSETGGRVLIPADLSSMKGIQYLAEELGKRERKLDIVVNNAGAI